MSKLNLLSMQLISAIEDFDCAASAKAKNEYSPYNPEFTKKVEAEYYEALENLANEILREIGDPAAGAGKYDAHGNYIP